MRLNVLGDLWEMLVDKPYADSCDRNQEPILTVIQPILEKCRTVLEIASGTGQHAVFFAGAMPHLTWYTSECEERHLGIEAWLNEAQLPNIIPPFELDVRHSSWPDRMFDAVFSANSAHIMHWPDVEALFAGVGRVLPPLGAFLLYGPFCYGGVHTSESNSQFDQRLRQRDPQKGVRDVHDLQHIAEAAGLRLHEDFDMPANNRILYWVKEPEQG